MKILFIFNFLIIPLFSLSQSKLDSLLYELDRAEDNVVKVLLYKEVSKQYFNLSIDSAIAYGKQGLALAERIDFHEATADLNNNLGIFYRTIGLYNISIDYYFKSLEIKEQLNDIKGVASTQNNIGVVYAEMEDPDPAIRYYNESLMYYESVNDTLKIATLVMNIGNVFLLKGMYDSALISYNLAKPEFESRNIISNLHKIYLNIGESYENKHVFDSAQKYFDKALEISLKGTNQQWHARAYLYKGRLLLNHDSINQSFVFLKRAYTIGEEIGDIRTQRDASELLMEYFASINRYDSSFYYSSEYINYNNILSFSTLNRSLGIAETDFKYQSEIRENEINITRQRFSRNIMILFSILTLLLTVYIYRSYRNKQKANRLLAEMDELKSRLFSNISHEFRTPLTLILGPLEEMLVTEKEKKPTRKTVKMMRRNANRLLNLVNQMLDLSKLDAGSMKLELVEGDLIKSLKLIVLSFASLAEQKKIKFIYTFPEEKWTTCFDQDKLEKILNNLLSNAFKYTPEEGEVKCVVKMPDPGKNLVEISIQDTGKGIPADQLDKIFDRFHQVEKSYELETVGTGIGLSLTKELVNLLHGDIKVESDLGKGTSFIIRLPVGKEHLKESEYILVKKEKLKKPVLAEELEVVTEEEGYAEDPLQEKKPEEEFPLVLTVEDHADIRTHIREHLEDSFRIIEAEDGVAGLDKAIENIPDLVITDLMMPKMDGVEMCKKLKTDERTSHIPVLMLTAKASVEDRVKGLETGADAYVTKPFNIKELRVRVTKLIEQRKKLRERFSRNIKLEPKDIAITSADEKFLNRAIGIIEEKMGDFEFDAQTLQQEMTLSRSQLFRKLKALTDLSITEFIRTIRLKRGAKLLEQKFGNVAQVTYEVGFNNLSYFAKCFKELYGVSPSEYVKQNSGS